MTYYFFKINAQNKLGYGPDFGPFICAPVDSPSAPKNLKRDDENTNST